MYNYGWTPTTGLPQPNLPRAEVICFIYLFLLFIYVFLLIAFHYFNPSFIKVHSS